MLSSCLLLIPLMTNELRLKRANLNWKILAAVEQDELKSDDNWKTTEGLADMLKEYENAMCRWQEWPKEKGNVQIKLVFRVTKIGITKKLKYWQRKMNWKLQQIIDNLQEWRTPIQTQIIEYRKNTDGLKIQILSTNMQSTKNTEWIQMDWKLRIIDKRQEWRSGQSLTFFLSGGFAHRTVLYYVFIVF